MDMMMTATSSINKSLKDHTYLKDLDKSSNIHSSGMSVEDERTSIDKNTFFNKSMQKANTMGRKRGTEFSSGGRSPRSTDRNSLYDTYHKIKTLKAGIKPGANQKPSLRNFAYAKASMHSQKPFNTHQNSILAAKSSIESADPKSVGFSIYNEPST